jgi:hypothetical protein
MLMAPAVGLKSSNHSPWASPTATGSAMISVMERPKPAGSAPQPPPSVHGVCAAQPPSEPGGKSSTAPLQLSSQPLQLSALPGPTAASAGAQSSRSVVPSLSRSDSQASTHWLPLASTEASRGSLSANLMASEASETVTIQSQLWSTTADAGPAAWIHTGGGVTAPPSVHSTASTVHCTSSTAAKPLPDTSPGG